MYILRQERPQNVIIEGMMICSVQRICQFASTVNILNKISHTQKMNLIVERPEAFVMLYVLVISLRRIIECE